MGISKQDEALRILGVVKRVGKVAPQILTFLQMPSISCDFDTISIILVDNWCKTWQGWVGVGKENDDYTFVSNSK